eukprot:gnl/Carplike_NY0171/2158_a2904_448.p1 GENE.gnl/Carplike_NY0171/2158_a2904_448~~gnl/Carplike_NY0171/2158_a2904_448.p1  ORF type:complete len:885 (-),score=245.44 gnl/Carplike_NY0171/2158_a2904_448:807-3065(-)
MVDNCCQMAGVISVPVYDTSSPADIQYMISLTDAEILFISPTLAHVFPLLYECEKVKLIVVLDEDEEKKEWVGQREDLFADSLARLVASHFPDLFPPPEPVESLPILFERVRSKMEMGASSSKDAPTPAKSPISLLGPNDEDTIKFIANGGRFISLSQLRAIGRTSYIPHKDIHPLTRTHPMPLPDSVFTIIFTSGSTGYPNGAVITHRAMTYALARLQQRWLDCEDQRAFIFLPQAHVYQRCFDVLTTYCAGQLLFYSGSLATMGSDMEAAIPTQMALVPRVLEKIYNGVMATLEKKGAIAQLLYKWCFNLQFKSIQKRKKRSWFPDALVLNNIKRKTGGKLTMMCCGAAPMSKDLAIFTEVAIGGRLIEGYGATETCAATCAMQAGDGYDTFGTVGDVMFNTTVRLCDVPELGYYVNPEKAKAEGKSPINTLPTGEILIAGPCLFDHYLKNPEHTAESFTSDGFYRSGDVGEMTSCGKVRIVDRIKSFFKLAQGEFVAAEKIEVCIRKSSFIEQVYVSGKSTERYIATVIVPNMISLRKAMSKVSVKASEHHRRGKGEEEEEEKGHIPPKEIEFSKMNDAEFLAQPRVKEAIFVSVLKHCSEDKLKGFELPRYMVIDPVNWEPESGLVSPALKIRRPPLKKYYERSIDRLYKIARAEEARRLSSTPAKKKVDPKSRTHAPSSVFSATSASSVSSGSHFKEMVGFESEFHVKGRHLACMLDLRAFGTLEAVGAMTGGEGEVRGKVVVKKSI